MRKVKKSPMYLPSTYTQKTSNNKNSYPSRITPSFKYNIPSIVGVMLLLGGMISLFSRSFVFTPMRLFNSIGGVKFSTATFLIFLSIIFIVINHKNIFGYLLLSLGALVICFSLFTSLRIGFTQTSLIKTILMFSAVFIGITLIFKSFIHQYFYK